MHHTTTNSFRKLSSTGQASIFWVDTAVLARSSKWQKSTVYLLDASQRVGGVFVGYGVGLGKP